MTSNMSAHIIPMIKKKRNTTLRNQQLYMSRAFHGATLLVDCAGQSMDRLTAGQSINNYTILKVSNSYSRLWNSITIFVTYN